VGQRNHVLDVVEIPHANWGNFEGGNGSPLLCRELCKNDRTDRHAILDAESSMDPVNRVLYVGAHWRDLVNTTEPSMCGGDAALCQITLTTCLL